MPIGAPLASTTGNALMPFLIQGERPFRDDLDGPAQELFDLTAHCLIADTINHAGSSSIELFWDVTKDLDGLELTSAALSMAAVRVLTAVVPDEDGSFLWLSEHGAAYGLCQIYDNEPWHYELRPEAVEYGCPATYADPTQNPRMQR